jgi:hypothetical protein
VLLQASRVRAAASAWREVAAIILTHDQHPPFALAMLAEAVGGYRRVGWLAEAAPLVAAAKAMVAERREDGRSATRFLINSAALAVEIGDTSDATDSLHHAKLLIDQHGLAGHAIHRDEYVPTLVRLHAASGDGTSAIRALSERGTNELADNDYVGLRTSAIALLASDDAGAAAQRCERGLASLGSEPRRSTFGEAEAEMLMLLGRARLLTDHANAAVDVLRRAEVRHRDLYDGERSPWLALVQVLLGQSLLATGDRDAAAGMLRSAEAIYASHERLGPQYTAPLSALRSRLVPP